MIRTLKSKESQDISKREALDIIIEKLNDEIKLAQRNVRNPDKIETSNHWEGHIAYQLGMEGLAVKMLQFIPDKGITND